MPLTYRLLTPDEWPKLDALIPREFIPSPETSLVAIAEDDSGRIRGQLTLQLQWHLEPLTIEHPSVNFLRLKETLDNQLRNFPGSCYYAFVDNERVAEMAELAGLAPMQTTVFRGEVK